MLMYQVSYLIMKMAGNTHTQYFMFATKVLLCIFILPTQNNNIATLSILCICWLMSRYIYYCLILYGYQQREGRLKGWQYVSTLNCNWGRKWRHLNWINKNISRILSFIEQ